MSTPLPQVTSPSFDNAASPVAGRRAVRQTPTSAVRRRGRETDSARRRRSRSRSLGNSVYSSPYDAGTPGTPGTPVATPVYATPVGTPMGTPSFHRGTYPLTTQFYIVEFLSDVFQD